MFDAKQTLEKQRAFFETGRTSDINFRIRQLRLLGELIKKYEPEILEALRQDLNKSPFEAYATEVGIVLEELKFVLRRLPGWARPKRVGSPLMLFPSSSRLLREPYGSVLILSPWNYPFQLTLMPLIGAIAAGNCAVVKPSAYSAHTSALLARILPEIFDESFVAVVQGGREANKSLLDEKFNYIFFTGSPDVGRVVMESAARHLTPMTLELGGKSPCIVDETANLKLAAKRIVWGKLLNAGQTCVAPDYLLVHSKIKDELLREMKGFIKAFYGESPETSPGYPKIINQRHFERLIGLTEGQSLITGGQSNAETRQIAPTLLDEPSWDSPVMQEEIFGPLLPVISFDSLGEVIGLVRRRPKPLALYFFTTSREHENLILSSLSFGGGCINDAVIHLSSPKLPFGGVGESGMGQYHGRASFDAFSHQKSIMKKSNFLDLHLRYPPYDNHLGLLKKIMK